MVARLAHNQEDAGSIPAPATNTAFKDFSLNRRNVPYAHVYFFDQKVGAYARKESSCEEG